MFSGRLNPLKEELSGQGSKRETAIHEARKSVKKIRGALRLMRPGLGNVYRDENDAFRDIGRRLSEVRDAVAMIEVFDSVVEKFKDGHSEERPRFHSTRITKDQA